MFNKVWPSVRARLKWRIIFSSAVAIVLIVLPYTGWDLSTTIARGLFIVGLLVAVICVIFIVRNEMHLRKTARDVLVDSTPTEIAGGEDIAVTLDSTLTKLQAAYDGCGDKAIAYPIEDYEANYLSKHTDWQTTQAEFRTNRPAAIIWGLSTCYRQPLRLGDKEHDFVGIPLLLEAEESDSEIRKWKAVLTDIDVRFGDPVLHRGLEELKVFLKIRESYRVIYQLALKYSIPNKKLWQMYLNKVNIAEEKLAVYRAEARKRVEKLQRER